MILLLMADVLSHSSLIVPAIEDRIWSCSTGCRLNNSEISLINRKFLKRFVLKMMSSPVSIVFLIRLLLTFDFQGKPSVTAIKIILILSVVLLHKLGKPIFTPFYFPRNRSVTFCYSFQFGQWNRRRRAYRWRLSSRGDATSVRMSHPITTRRIWGMQTVHNHGFLYSASKFAQFQRLTHRN